MAKILVQFLNDCEACVSAVVREVDDDKLPEVIAPGITLRFRAEDAEVDEPWDLDLEECCWDLDEGNWRFISRVTLDGEDVEEAVKEAGWYGFQEFWTPHHQCDCPDCQKARGTVTVTYNK